MLSDKDILHKMKEHKKKIFVNEVHNGALFHFKRGPEMTMRRDPSDHLQRYQFKRYYRLDRYRSNKEKLFFNTYNTEYKWVDAQFWMDPSSLNVFWKSTKKDSQIYYVDIYLEDFILTLDLSTSFSLQ